MGSNSPTTISYRIDARGLQEARRQLQAAFKPDILKQYNVQAQAVAKTVGALTKAQGALNAQLKQVGGAVLAYKALGQAIQGTATAYGRMKQAVGSYGMAGLPGAGSVGRAAGAYAAPPQGPAQMSPFRQGVYQGLSPALGQWIGTKDEPDARRQLMGQYVGSGARRLVGGAMNAANGMMGGQGPLSTMFGNIPFIGGAASQAEAMAGSARQNYAARLQALPFLGENLGGSGHWEEGTPAGAGAPTTKATGAFGYDSSSQMIPYAERHANEAGKRARAHALALGLSPQEAEQASRIGESFGRAKATGGPIQKATPAGSPKWVTDSESYAGIGRLVGMDETSSIQMASGLGKSIGGAGGMGPDRFRQILGAQTMGVDAEASAQLLRQLQPGRGGQTRDQQNVLARTIGDAMTTGLANSEISEYLEDIAKLQEQAANRGVRLSTEGVSGLAVAISGTGIGGLQGMRLAGQFTGAAGAVADRGVSNPVDVQMARAAGYDPRVKGSYIKSMRALEGGMTPDMLQGFVGKLGAGLQGDERSFVLKRALKQAGVDVSFGQADQLGAGNFKAIQSSMTGKELGGKLNELPGGIVGALRQQADIQNQLLAAGKNSLPVVARLEMSAAKLATAMSTLEPTLNKYIADPVVALSSILQDLINALGGGGHPGLKP